MLNSSLVNFLVRSYSVTGGKSFAPPHIMEYVKLPEFDQTGESHIELVRLSKACHRALNKQTCAGLPSFESKIVRIAARCLGLSKQESHLAKHETYMNRI